jgi:hypothetical protein
MREFLVIFVKTVESLKTFLIFFVIMFTTFTSTMVILIKNFNKLPKESGESFKYNQEYSLKTFEDAKLVKNFSKEFYEFWTYLYWTFLIFVTGVDNPGYDTNL